MVISRLLLTVAAAAPFALAAGTGAAADESYPSRVVTVVVPYAAGGPSDTVGRILAEALTGALGQQVIVENVPGARGSVGAGRVAKAEPDGYTQLLHTPAHATNTIVHSSGIRVSVKSPRVAIASGSPPTRGSAAQPMKAGPPT